MEWISWAERELADKTGAEKKKVVVDKLVELIDIPFVPDLIESPIERMVYGMLIDRGVAWLNILGGGYFKDLILTEEQKDKVIEMIDTPVEKIVDVPDLPEASGVDEKLNALYAKYASK
jgi:hypothetical protein